MKLKGKVFKYGADVNTDVIIPARFLRVRPVARNIRAFALYVRLGFNHVGSIELFQELSPTSDRKWKPGIVIHGRELSY